MKFIINKQTSYTNKNRVRILNRQEVDYITCADGRKEECLIDVTYLCNVVINTTKDWDMDAEFSIVDEISSVQYRPKGIFQNSKGFYYKTDKVVYLTEEEVNEMMSFITKAAEYVKNN